MAALNVQLPDNLSHTTFAAANIYIFIHHQDGSKIFQCLFIQPFSKYNVKFNLPDTVFLITFLSYAYWLSKNKPTLAYGEDNSCSFISK